MAIIISGDSICPLCEKTIEETDEIIMFPPFVQNTKDAFYVFNDVGVHKKCIENHPLGDIALSYLKKVIFKTRPENRICDIGGNEIMSYDNYLFIDLLSSDKREDLSKFNFLTIDKNNLSKWVDKEAFLKEANMFLESGKWNSLTSFNYLQYLINEVSGYSSPK